MYNALKILHSWLRFCAAKMEKETFCLFDVFISAEWKALIMSFRMIVMTRNSDCFGLRCIKKWSCIVRKSKCQYKQMVALRQE